MKTIDQELEQIRQATGADNIALIRPEDGVAFAKAHPDSALHRRLNWDDGDAGHQWRLHQMRQIIRVCVTILPNCNKPVRAYVSLTTDRREPGGGYRSTAAVMAVQKDREQLLADALAELEPFRRKYAMFQELAGVFAAIDAATAKIAEKAKAKVAAKPKTTKATTASKRRQPV